MTEGAIHPGDDTPGAENSPVGAGSPTVEDRVEPGGAPPPASNQGKDEPVKASPGQAPGTSGSDSTGTAPTVTSPGDLAGVSQPGTAPAGGTSEESDVVQGVRGQPLAAPGRPAGEVDTRR